MTQILFMILAVAVTWLPSDPGEGNQEALTNYRIVYSVQVDAAADNYDVFSMRCDGSDIVNLTNHPAVDWLYEVVGSKLYFVSDREGPGRKLYYIYEMDWDGRNLRKLTPFPVVDSWLSSRKQGREFVVTSAKDGAGHELYLIDRNGIVLRRLTHNTFYENDPQFSPNGQQIVFRSKRSGIDELYITAVDENHAWQQLTQYPNNDDTLADGRGYHAGPPRWSPDGNWISFASKRQGNYSIFAVKPDGSNLQQLTPNGRDEIWHAWSPSGQWLAFDGTIEAGNYDIFIMNQHSRQIQRLTQTTQAEHAPVFVQVPSQDAR